MSGFAFGTTPAQPLGTGLNLNVAKTQATTTPFSFGVQTTTTASPFVFGTSTANKATGLGGVGLFAKPTVPTTTTQFIGLGGVDISASQPKAGEFKPDSIKVKETQVPDEITKTVEAMKSYIKKQKTLSSDISRTSISKHSGVSSDIAGLQWSLQEVTNSVDANYNHIKLLKNATSKAIQSVEMAQRTQDTPGSLQYENVAPFQFFVALVQKYEEDLINFRQQIQLTERHMLTLHNPNNITPNDLKRGLKQINESFISLAGRLHEIHQKVEEQKEQYLNLRKYRLHDTTNVFAQLDNPELNTNTSKISSGPTPFSNLSALNNFGKSITQKSGNVNTTQTK